MLSPQQEQPTWLHALLPFCHTKRYEKNVNVVRPGEPAETLYYLLEGSAAVLIEEDDEQREIVLAYINKGEFIGEMGLFWPQSDRSVVVRTRVKCQIAEISYKRVSQLLDNELREHAKGFLCAVGYQLSQRLRQTSRKVGHLAFLDVTGRIARALLDLCAEPDAMTHPDGMQIYITRQEIGRIVGCSREMAGRVLKNMEAEGLVYVKGKTIVVHGTR